MQLGYTEEWRCLGRGFLTIGTPNLSTDNHGIWHPSDLDPRFLCPALHFPWILLTHCSRTEKLLYCYSQSRLSPLPLVSHHPPSGADRSWGWNSRPSAFTHRAI
ncbi:hypothetical protein LEMLEM_LOCUS16892 [Lemmus lemmus]